MISQDPFLEIDQKLKEVSEHQMKDVYGISISDFLNLPEEFQDMLVLHYWQSLRKKKEKQNVVEKIEHIMEKKKVLNIFKKNK